MKSLLIGRPGDIRRVYPDDILTSLREEAGLDTGTILTRDELASAGPADADCLFSTWGMPALAEEEIARFFPKLKAVFYAAGTVQGFARPFLNRGIRIFSAWGANAVPVAEFTVSQILLANKGFFGAAALCSAGQVQAARRHAAGFPGNVRCKVGIIGAGMIGSMVIRMLHGRELDVLVYDPFLPPEKAAEWGVRSVSLETLFSECQTVSNHLANNPRTAGILNYPLFSLMPANGVFINTGRGPRWWKRISSGPSPSSRDAPPCSTSPARNRPRPDTRSTACRTSGSPPISQAAPGMKWNVCPATCSRNSDACGKGSPPYTK